jgi:hypothetical protein
MKKTPARTIKGSEETPRIAASQPAAAIQYLIIRDTHPSLG